jgi:hypothetical protein
MLSDQLPNHHPGPARDFDFPIHELHVAWLLALCGLSPILLGEYEHLVAKNTKVERASADILAGALDRRLLAVIACTLGIPNEADIANLVHVCEILRRETFGGTSVRVQPVIFTGAVGYGAHKEVQGVGVIPVVDTDGAQALLRLVQAGQGSRFLEFVDNPMFYPLQKPSAFVG